jgi:hypothetical protein
MAPQRKATRMPPAVAAICGVPPASREADCIDQGDEESGSGGAGDLPGRCRRWRCHDRRALPAARRGRR